MISGVTRAFRWIVAATSSPECAVGATAAVLGADELRPIRGQVIAIDSRKEQLHAPPARDRGVGLLSLHEGVLGDLQGLLELLHLEDQLGDRADIDDGELRLRGITTCEQRSQAERASLF